MQSKIVKGCGLRGGEGSVDNVGETKWCSISPWCKIPTAEQDHFKHGTRKIEPMKLA